MNRLEKTIITYDKLAPPDSGYGFVALNCIAKKNLTACIPDLPK